MVGLQKGLCLPSKLHDYICWVCYVILYVGFAPCTTITWGWLACGLLHCRNLNCGVGLWYNLSCESQANELIQGTMVQFNYRLACYQRSHGVQFELAIIICAYNNGTDHLSLKQKNGWRTDYEVSFCSGLFCINALSVGEEKGAEESDSSSFQTA